MMSMKSLKLAALALSLALTTLACSTTQRATEFNGLSTPGGTPTAHLNTTNWALNLLISTPLVGDASLQQTVADFTAAARDEKASKVQIVQSSSCAWWFILPPFSFIITPVKSNVAGDAIR